MVSIHPAGHSSVYREHATPLDAVNPAPVAASYPSLVYAPLPGNFTDSRSGEISGLNRHGRP